ncbi:thermostable hemolysin [Alteromonas aestuariivivens]|uniref:thermostable hemolysin n=1 Tax=Alteromonas aestuariivivens TaxID=1938339 RepID=UPI0015F253D1|nr:thermostable hemolysin [Alteromonas aestuariivivens]
MTVISTSVLQTRPAAESNRSIRQFTLITASAISPNRKHVETFIANGYANAFNANIRHFYPVLVAVDSNGVRAALGLRSAQQPFFTEQYLPEPLTESLARKGIVVPRNEIIEVGNLCSVSSRFTLPLLLAVCSGVFIRGKRYLIFTATQKLKEFFCRNDLSLHYLADAREACLKEPKDDWGSYYQTNPQVFALAVEDVVRLMLSEPGLRRLWNEVSGQLAPLDQQLRCLG